MESAEPQRLLILSGVVGSGKTTLAEAIVKEMPNYARVSQDDLGNRQACESLVRRRLKEGMNVVLDRQNFDKTQRKVWLEIANEFPNLVVSGMVMGTPYSDCRSRLIKRRNHPTVDNPQLALSLLDKFSDLWVQPSLDEGFDNLVILPSLPPSESLTLPYLTSVFDLLNSTPKNPHAKAQRKQGKNFVKPRVATAPVRSLGGPAPPAPASTWRGGTNAWSWATAATAGKGNILDEAKK